MKDAQDAKAAASKDLKDAQASATSAAKDAKSTATSAAKDVKADATKAAKDAKSDAEAAASDAKDFVTGDTEITTEKFDKLEAELKTALADEEQIVRTACSSQFH